MVCAYYQPVSYCVYVCLCCTQHFLNMEGLRLFIERYAKVAIWTLIRSGSLRILSEANSLLVWSFKFADDIWRIALFCRVKSFLILEVYQTKYNHSLFTVRPIITQFEAFIRIGSFAMVEEMENIRLCLKGQYCPDQPGIMESECYSFRQWLKIIPHMIKSYYRCCCINEPVIFSHSIHLELGHRSMPWWKSARYCPFIIHILYIALNINFHLTTANLVSIINMNQLEPFWVIMMYNNYSCLKETSFTHPIRCWVNTRVSLETFWQSNVPAKSKTLNIGQGIWGLC